MLYIIYNMNNLIAERGNLPAMARPLRIQFEGALFHVISRGDRDEAIFKEDRLKEYFLGLLEKGAERFETDIYAYCVMATHYHLLLQLNKTNLVEFMHYLGSSYANYLVSHGWKGHVFRGRYKAILVDREEYLLTVVRYIHLNPVAAGLVERPEQYPWSSYGAYLGGNEGRSWLKYDWLTSYFGQGLEEAISAFRHFTEEGLSRDPSSYPDNLIGGLVLGRPEYIFRMLSRIEDDHICEYMRKKLSVPSLSLEEIHSRVCHVFALQNLRRGDYRNNPVYRRACDLFLYLAKNFSSSKNGAIGNELGGVSGNAIASRYHKLRRKMERDNGFREDFLRQVNLIIETGNGKGLTPDCC